MELQLSEHISTRTLPFRGTVLVKAMADMNDILHRKYNFQWEILDVIIGGKSLIDMNMGLSGFPMRTKEDAERFIRSYGYDIEDPIEAAELLGNFQEAISFIRKYFLHPENSEGLKLEVPRKILEITDVRDLILMASKTFPGQMNDTQGYLLQNWACSILKVIHCISHLDKDLRADHFPDIQKQILDRFYRVIHRDTDGNLFLANKPNDPYGVSLVSFETKPKKARDSMLIKLLHKAESVAEDIFDRVGIRFITRSRLDCLRVVKFLKDSMVVMPANIKPSRSRNTLIDFSQFKKPLRLVLDQLDRSEELSEDLIRELLEEATLQGFGSSHDPENPHSSPFYRSIQFTCRQLIKLKNPLFEDLKKLKTQAKQDESTLSIEMKRMIEQLDLQHLRREVRFFYPYEIQVMDQTSSIENEKGLSAHSQYKRSQIQTAMKRVMGSLMPSDHAAS